ncbi:aminopeptidase P family protein [Ensifer sp. ENS05]|uniref:M24 family metallopeptidase n=1 Tax=Ensifer sp. ENS05 TaxID=2769277 RepID=UPI00177C6BCF|nr:Xaa-Pro peptidase family protein [Ensifer sp. ENS05]MBD9596366.1 aminopeptidase P family protein [Ensifer sp. ENS05]
MLTKIESDATRRWEGLLDGFTPSFDFEPVPPLPLEEFQDRLRRIRQEASQAGHDVMLVHTDVIGWYHTSNSYLRYICDWMREGMLIIPTDADRPLTLLSFYGSSVILPPAGEPLLVEDIWQIAPWGREYLDRPGSAIDKTAQACTQHLVANGLDRAQIGLVGDHTSEPYWHALKGELPKARFEPARSILDRMQRVRSPREVALVRAASQLISIGYEAACHVTRRGVTDHEIYAAFTYAQLARGGETGDGYQIGINEFGTHCGKPYGHVVRDGDLINLYVSNVTYRGYYAQTARMIAVGSLTDRQEEVIAVCLEGMRRAEAEIRPGALARQVNNAAFTAYVDRGLLENAEARTMPFNWEAMPNGSPRLVPRQYVSSPSYEAQGRKLMHVYPATHGPHNPNLGHSVGMPKTSSYNISSNNYGALEEGMVFVLHAQWLEPLSAGCNIGDCYAVTTEGYENLSRHTPLEPHRIR